VNSYSCQVILPKFLLLLLKDISAAYIMENVSTDESEISLKFWRHVISDDYTSQMDMLW